MKIRFQGDSDFSKAIIVGLVREEPSIDFRTGDEAGLRGLPDGKVLAIASEDNRVLVSHDRRTMPKHFANLLKATIVRV